MIRFIFLVLFCFAGVEQSWGAENYPNKTVHVIVPFAAGGVTDLTARLISQQLTLQLGKSFVVDNRTGAGGIIGNEIVAKSAPDGYTLSLVDMSLAMIPGMYKSLPFDVIKDFAPVSQIVGAPMVLVVHPSLNVNTVKEFIALAQAQSGKLNYGSGGVGTPQQVVPELFKRIAKINVVHVPYKGGAEATNAVLGGQVQMLMNTMPTVLQHVNSGRLKALAVTTSGKRSSILPDVPSISEAGIGGMTVYLWFGLAAPAGTPKDIIYRLHAEISKAIETPSVKDPFVAQGAEMIGSRPEEFASHIASELRRWTDVIKAAGITAD